jgi:peptidoglycan/LPS O-acetylase OafA/YrhL
MRRTAKPGDLSVTDHDPNLNILRAVAVLAVFLAHSLQVISGGKRGDHFAYGVETPSLGHAGVLLFFVHTSLVLMRSLERTGSNLTGWPLIRQFYIRRVFRIYPLSVCLILLCISFAIPPNALNVTYHWDGMLSLSANLLLMQNMTSFPSISTPLWSLPYEVQMYLALPIIFFLLKSPAGGMGLPFIYVAGAVSGSYYPLLQYVPCFLAGVVAYKLASVVQPSFAGWLWLPAITGAVVLYVEIPFPDLFFCMLAGLAIPLFRASRGAIPTVASYIAKYSYGIYLCHTPILWLIYRKLTIPAWQRPIWLVLATASVSASCYFAIEQPLIRIGGRVANGVFVKPVAETACATG